VQLSIPGTILGAAYFAFVLYLAGKVVARNTFGGLFSQEFPLAVFTLPLSYLGESLRLFRRHNYCRLGLYLVAGLLNSSLFYLLGMGLTALGRRLGAA